MSAPAPAQLRLPTVAPLTRPLSAVDQSLDDLQARSLAALSEARDLQIGRLVRANPATLDLDEHGNPIVRGEVLALNPSEAALLQAAALHFDAVREERIDALGVRLVVLKAPPGLSGKRALRDLRRADPAGVYDYNHIYTGSGTSDAAQPAAPGALVRDAGDPAPPGTQAPRIRIGLMDTGINAHHRVFQGTSLHTYGCDSAPVADAHGTEVASLMIGESDAFRGVTPRAELFAADVYCGKPTGGAVDALVAAFNWLVQLKVAVINVSLVGPPNALLERTVAALTERGFVIVAAVGNDGPAAPPLYPASYPRVVGVTGVDAHGKALIEAARGPQVMFAAPGSELAAASGEGYAAVRGTSFASPIVAALLAARLPEPGPELAAAALDDLIKSAVHAGKPGRDLTYGYGVVGSQYRIDPQTLIHR
jgi:subtilisin family serine protease